MVVTIIAALLALVGASYTDLKTREVPDWISHGLIYLGFGIAIITSIIQWSLGPIAYSLAGFALTGLIAVGMYKLGQWGGGDSKLLMGMGALLGISFTNLSLATLLVNSLLAGAIYGIGFSVYLAIKNRKVFLPQFHKMTRTPTMIKMRIIMLALVLVTVALLFFLPTGVRLPLLTFIAAFYIIFYLWMVIRAIEASCMMKEVSIKELTEGDWVTHDVIVDKKVIVTKKDLGVSKEQLILLQNAAKKGKIKTVTIKIGIPFVPSFLIAYLLTLAYGNWYLVFL